MFGMSLGIGRVNPLFRLGRIGISPGMNRLKSLFIGMSSQDGTQAKGAKARLPKLPELPTLVIGKMPKDRVIHGRDPWRAEVGGTGLVIR
jgi:hypothetical protein